MRKNVKLCKVVPYSAFPITSFRKKSRYKRDVSVFTNEIIYFDNYLKIAGIGIFRIEKLKKKSGGGEETENEE